ncbi:hypothetical protein D3C84_796070 [compost metagenome]
MMCLACAGPLPPAVKLQSGIDHLQQHVRIQLDLVKDPAVDQHHDQADRPAPGVLFDRQPDGNDAEGGGKQFKPGHAGSLGKSKRGRIVTGLWRTGLPRYQRRGSANRTSLLAFRPRTQKPEIQLIFHETLNVFCVGLRTRDLTTLITVNGHK